MIEISKENFEFPQFPALAKCILVDARLGSRGEIVKNIKASSMFMEIVEAKSVQNGLGMLEAQETDALFLGPSVTIQTMLDFLAEGGKRARSGDCAFMAIVEATTDDEQISALFAAGAHNVLKQPFSRARFFEAVVHAVVRANANSPWTSLFNQAVEAGLMEALPVALVADTADAIGTVTQLGAPEEESENPAVAAMRSSSGRLKDIVAGVDRGVYSLDMTGVPTPRSAEALNDVVDAMLSSTSLDETEAQSFRRFVTASLFQWFVDLVLEGKSVAAERLKNSLSTYAPKA